MNVVIDPGVVTLIQSNFLEQIRAGFATTANYATYLLYLLATIEITVLGLVWALQRDLAWEKLFFKIIKIGLIYFIIRNYPWLVNTILYSFAKLAGVVINNANVAQYVFNPAKIWQYGYNIGVHILEFSVSSTIPGMTIIEVAIGLGILLVFGLLGIQMVLQVISFYLVSFGSLILLPLGAITSGRGMFDKAVQAVLKSGLRLMALIIIIGIATVTWDGFQLNDLATAKTFTLNQPLGLFFTALLFLCLAIYLPKVVSEAVGDLNSSILEGGQPVTVTAREPTVAFPPIASGTLANMQAATTIGPGSLGGGGASYEGAAGTAAAATIPTAVTSGSGGGLETRAAQESTGQASAIAKSISATTVKKIQDAVNKAIKENK